MLIAYYSQPGNQSVESELYIMDSAGGVPNRLTDNNFADKWPDWSPDSLRLAFTSGSGLDSGQQAIFILDFATNVVTQLTEGQTHDDDPAWSPDGTRLVFVRQYADEADITIMDANSGTMTRIPVPGTEASPSWSPDGSLIAFTSGWAIYTMRTDGSNVRLRTLDPSWGAAGSVSWIARQ